MTVGDVASGFALTGAGAGTFRPASGIKVMITAVIGNHQTLIASRNGSLTSAYTFGAYSDSSYAYFETINTRMPVDNTNYITWYANNGYSGVTGIVIG